jgi:hypothetical protein
LTGQPPLSYLILSYRARLRCIIHCRHATKHKQYNKAQLWTRQSLDHPHFLQPIRPVQKMEDAQVEVQVNPLDEEIASLKEQGKSSACNSQHWRQA